jgi:hypothetical protein
LNAIAKILE